MRGVLRPLRRQVVRLTVRLLPPTLVGYAWRNPLFERDWYLERNPDVQRAGMDPERHYRRHGAREGRDPNRLFSTTWYQRHYPDVTGRRINPLDHFWLFGGAERRDPSPVFVTEWYLRKNIDVVRSGMNPLEHYMRHGQREGRSATPLDDNASKATAALAATAFVPVGGNAMSPHRPPRLGLSIPKGKPVVLIIDDKYPRASYDAGSVQTANQIKVLVKLGYHVIFIPTWDDDDHAAKQETQALGAHTVDRDRSVRDIVGALAGEIQVALLSRVDCGGSFLEAVQASSPDAKVIFYPHDLHWLRRQREAATTNDRHGMFVAMATREREVYLTRLADATIVFSQHERDLLGKVAPGARVFWTPLIHDVVPVKESFDAREGIGFVGGYMHPPNLDAVTWFLDFCWPLIRHHLPNIKFYAIGPHMPPELMNRKDEHYVALGHVPDLSTQFARLRLTVAPLRYGAGAKGKVVSSLAHGVPCVATSVATEGMALSPNEIVTADEPTDFVNAVVALYRDESRWSSFSHAGLAFVDRVHSTAAAEQTTASIFSELGVPVPSSGSTAT